MAAELALDRSGQNQPLLDRAASAKPSRCAGVGGLDLTAEQLAEMLSQI